MRRSLGFLSHRRSALAAIFLFFLAVVLASVPNAQATITTYDFVNYFSVQNGWTLSGSITTDGATGDLAASDVLSASATASKGTTTYTLNGYQASKDLEVVGNSLELLGGDYSSFFYVGTGLSSPAELWYYNGYGNHYIEYGLQTRPKDVILWDDGGFYGLPGVVLTPPLSGDETPIVIATLASTDSTVPEPATIIVWSLLGSIAVGLGWWRKRGAA